MKIQKKANYRQPTTRWVQLDCETLTALSVTNETVEDDDGGWVKEETMFEDYNVWKDDWSSQDAW